MQDKPLKIKHCEIYELMQGRSQKKNKDWGNIHGWILHLAIQGLR